VVRVLTIHAAKGLGFDLVILPDFEGLTLDKMREGLAVQRSEDRQIEWVLDLPKELFYAADEVLSAHVATRRADAAYEAMCKFYVAMTRAKRAMYVITEPVGTSKSQNFPKLLEQTLGDTWAVGDAAWFEGLAAKEEESAPPALAPLDPATVRRVARLPSRRPSDDHADGKSVRLFAAAGSGAADFGTKVHSLFETVEWWHQSAAAAWQAARQQEGASAEALAEVLRTLNHPQCAVMFSAAGDYAEVWRERVFEVIVDGVWLTGVFDRVLVARDAKGRVTQAWVIDFKTDRAGPSDGGRAAVAKHAGQLNLYRRVAAILTGLPLAQVECSLVLTAGPSLVTVPQSV
jgi:ATP-dependent helicase/nuclease subunit A